MNVVAIMGCMQATGSTRQETRHGTLFPIRVLVVIGDRLTWLRANPLTQAMITPIGYIEIDSIVINTDLFML